MGSFDEIFDCSPQITMSGGRNTGKQKINSLPLVPKRILHFVSIHSSSWLSIVTNTSLADTVVYLHAINMKDSE